MTENNTGSAMCGASTPAATLRDHIMNPNVPKSEAEWWARERILEIEAQRHEAVGLLRQIAKTDEDWKVLTDHERTEVHAFLSLITVPA